MSALAEIAVHPVAQALTWALVHFIWQGAALGLLAFAILRFAPLSAQGRYVAGIVTLTAMLAAPIATTAWLLDGGGIVAPPLAAAAGGTQHAGFVVATSEAVIPSLDDITGSASVMPIGFTALVLPIWLGGVFLLSVRLLGGWVVARRLARRAIKPVGTDIQVIVRRIAAHLALDRVVRVFESTAVSVPVMMGWLRPVVLLPTAALGGLSPMQLEALIAHELAHVRRHDYVVNLLQSIVETLLFYHPAVWWVSKQVRAEREHCCDDLAVEVCDRIVYVSALAELAAITGSRGVALAATDGTLVTRVRRLLGRSREGEGIRTGWLPAFVVVFAVGAWMPAGFVRVDARDGQAVAIATAPQTAVPVVAATEAVPVVAQVSAVVAVPIQPQVGVIGSVAGGISGGVPVAAATASVPVLAGVDGGVPVGVMAGIQSGVALSPEEIQELKQRLEQLRRARTELELAEISKKLSIAVRQDEVRKLKEQLVAVEKIQADQAKLVELTKMSKLATLSADEALKSKLAALEKGEVEKVAVEKRLHEVLESALKVKDVAAQRGILGTTTQSGTGNFIWTNNDERVEMTWTGGFRLSADDRDIEWIEPGKSLRISDGNWLTATGVEIKGVENGVERTFFKKSVKLPYEPEGREFLATMLQKLIQRSVQTQGRFVRQSPFWVFDMNRAKPAITARPLTIRPRPDRADGTTDDLLVDLPREVEAATTSAEKADLLVAYVNSPRFTSASSSRVFELTAQLSSSADQRRVLDAAWAKGLTGMATAAFLKTVASVPVESDRVALLLAVAKGAPLSGTARSAYVSAADTIKSEADQTRVLAELVRNERRIR